ncbi:MAG: hypothetical protein CL678_16765, partial [Bdellovibrionaceae bacterium]|nr:hypothetical protein [Pseudobdellovibrionaceae bacterium]
TNNSVVYANIVNNNIIDHIHQRHGAINLDVNINYACMGNSWKSTKIPIKIHKQFIESIKKNELYRWKFDRWELNNYERVSINAICWKGGDMNNFKGIIKNGKIINNSEEEWISVIYPKSSKTPAVICGNALCAHAGFYTQRNEELEILIQEYEKYV